MNKSELIEAVADKTDMTKSDIDTALTGFFEVVASHVAKTDEKITIPGWLSIQQTQRAARMGRNPRTGESMPIAASKGVKVSAGSKLKNAAKGK